MTRDTPLPARRAPLQFQRNDAPPVVGRIRRVKYRILRGVSPRYRERLRDLSIDPQLRIPLNHSILTHDHRLLFVKNSKAGCTSVTHLLYFYSHGQAFQEQSTGEIHGSSGLQQGTENLLAIEETQPHPYVFSFVRDPLTRLLSAFHDFCIDERNPTGARHLRNLRALGLRPGLPPSEKLDLFLDYVEACMADSRLFCDRHWRLQSVNLGIGVLNYDFIGRLEQFQNHIQIVLRQTGRTDLMASPLLAKRHNRSSRGQASAQPSAAQRARIFALYREDYERFGYRRP